MPIRIEGVEYFTAADIQRTAGIVRQTLWRWRKAGLVPAGSRYRNKAIVFTRAEVEAISEYSNRVVPMYTPRRSRQRSASTKNTKGARFVPRKGPRQAQP